MDCIRYKGGFKYQLAEDYSVRVKIFPVEMLDTKFLCLTRTGVLTLRHGYACDGASGCAFDTKTIMRGAFVHDALYQLLRLGLLPQRYRLEADEELRRICLEDGMWKVRAWWVYRAVRLGGGPSTSPENKKVIMLAPKSCKEKPE